VRTRSSDKVRLAFNAADNAGDARALARLVDRDPVGRPPTGEPAIIGADNVAARYAVFFGRMRSTFELEPGPIRICGA